MEEILQKVVVFLFYLFFFIKLLHWKKKKKKKDLDFLLFCCCFVTEHGGWDLQQLAAHYTTKQAYLFVISVLQKLLIRITKSISLPINLASLSHE